jgi:hypothetical protein
VEPTVSATSGTLQIGKLCKLILTGSGFETGVKVVSNARGVKFDVHSVGHNELVLSVTITSSLKNGTYRLTITDKDGRSENVQLSFRVNKRTGEVNVHLVK